MTLTPPAAGSARIDPLGPSHPGRWENGPVVVCHVDRAAVPVRLVSGKAPELISEHFEVHRPGGRLLVLHRFRPDELDDDVSTLVAAELGPVVESAPVFERVVTGIVRSTVGDPLTAWSTFYANSLAVLRHPERAPTPGAPPEASLAGFAPVHARALDEVAGTTVADLGTCFGFLPLLMAERGLDVVATDHTPGTMRLLSAVAGTGIVPAATTRLRTAACDARAVPLHDDAVDTATAIHLLEHLPAADSAAVVAEMCRIARRRIVVAVPFEDEPDPVYGHLCRFTPDVLTALGERTGARFRVESDHGGWLVADAL
ncbi:mycofactocin oligosaccharide methyltransferase MftM [Actinomycetospora sp. TBRC 11914]|uniref:mycofactocin oligosaccharide methyltransferase MftM n=1 Tax=Actinomycetospora sp. TBRC 11914 TaxID=2729387 RepID=UPI00145DE7E8|nr:mycofactocin oligosaccharide methyltransferase MftM [Actinomycetospora sp. TBRC 11914]NMO88987.1 class I SAM-dependent methyltransferase [Actinomycetospora sp. TBRC 11914]